ncbi:MAG: hypothetical protein H6Q10_3767, partial [Acidobacteria bacterium]|nr:hypothetical protein [Acidobacteriota bacterium]
MYCHQELPRTAAPIVPRKIEPSSAVTSEGVSRTVLPAGPLTRMRGMNDAFWPKSYTTL